MWPASQLTNYTILPIKATKRYLKRDECNAILDKIAAKLHDPSSKARSILNTLSLIEFLLKNGSPRFKIEIEEDQFFIKKMKNFYDENDEEDLCKSIQSLVLRIIGYIENPDELRAAKEEAKKLKSRILGFGNEVADDETRFSGNNDSKYQGFSSDTYNENKYSGQNQSSLSQRLGLEAKQKMVEKTEPEVKREEIKVPESVIKRPVEDVDFLDLGSKKPDNLDLLDTNIESSSLPKFKGLGKLLPPPPKKNQPQFTGQTPAKGINNDPSGLLDVDIHNLDVTTTKHSHNNGIDIMFDAPVITAPSRQVQQTNNMNDFDFLAPQAIKNTVVEQPKMTTDFEFDFGGSMKKSEPTTIQKSNLNDFDFSNTNNEPRKNSDVDIFGDSKPKMASKLPVPPKKSQPVAKNDVDFLF